jgi:hypothetical protein
LDINWICSLKTKDNAPVGSHRDRPEALQISSKRMQVLTRKIHCLRRHRPIEGGQDTPDFFPQVWTDAAGIAPFIRIASARDA